MCVDVFLLIDIIKKQRFLQYCNDDCLSTPVFLCAALKVDLTMAQRALYDFIHDCIWQCREVAVCVCERGGGEISWCPNRSVCHHGEVTGQSPRSLCVCARVCVMQSGV